MIKGNINQFKCFLLFFLLSCVAQTVEAQGWIRNFLFGPLGGPYEAEGLYISAMPGFKGDQQLSLFNVPNDKVEFGPFWSSHRPTALSSVSIPGTPPHHRFCRSAVWGELDTLAVLIEAEPSTIGNRRLEMALFNAGYNSMGTDHYLDTVWIKDIYASNVQDVFATEIIVADDGNYLVLAELGDLSPSVNRDLLLVKVSPEGNTLWSSVLENSTDDRGLGLEQMPDGRILILENRQGTSSVEPWLVEVDADGQILVETNLSSSGTDEATGLASTDDGNLIISGLNHAAGEDVFLLKIDPDGNQLWRQDYAFPDQAVAINALVEDAAGDIVLAGKHQYELTSETGAFIMKVGGTGSPNWERIIRSDERDKGFTHIILHPNGSYVMGGWWTEMGTPHALVVQADLNGIIKPGHIYGNVFHDLDEDCLESAGDLPLEDWMVEANQNDTTIFYGDVDSLGNYFIECDTGNYTVNVIVPVGYWEACVVDTPIHLGYLDTVELDFPVQTEIECPYLTVDHNFLWARPCTSTVFYVNYCNLGTVLAEDAYVEILLDSVFSFESSQIPPSIINGNLLTFPLGDLSSNECGSFEFTAFTSCDAEVGFVACSEAHIYPDSLCFPTSPAWSGAIIESSGFCDGDSVRFTLTNTGAEPMGETLEYIVIEDAVLLMPGTYELGPGESMDVAIEANGGTFHLIAQQVPNAPGLSQPISAVEGCVGSSGNSPSTGFFNQFSGNEGDGFVSSICWPIVNSYDPNDKQPLPTGFTDEHFIFENTELEYRIRFQNTGSADALRVVLVDTLSRFLNPATVRPGASSHPYEFDIDGEGVLRFTFSDINLPPESVDEDGSNGFVNFKVAQKPGNELGTVIENSAAIYFDFNLPIITNTTWHTIHEPWIEIISDVDEANGSGLEPLSVYPNPSAGAVNFELPTEMNGDVEFKLFDSMGRMLRSEKFSESHYLFERENLVAGMYFYMVSNENGKLYSGRVVLR